MLIDLFIREHSNHVKYVTTSSADKLVVNTLHHSDIRVCQWSKIKL